LMMSLIAAMAFAESSGTSAGIMIWIVGWTLALVAVLRLLGDSWRNIATLVAPRLAIVLCLIVVFAMAISIPGETVLDWFSPGIELPPLALAAMFGQACLAATFYHLLKAPTLAGQKIRDEIQGFRMYLETAEKARMQALNSPRVTPEVFEQLLPYAIALDVENAWSRRFESETAQAGQNLNHDYSPNWYAGNAFRGLGDGGFTSRLGDCIGAATASATAGPLSAPSAQSLSVGFSNARSGGSGW